MRPFSLDVLVADAGRITVFVRGDVDVAARSRIDDFLAQIGTAPCHVTVDLAGVMFMDTTGLAGLVALHNQCGLNGGSLTVRHPRPIVQRLMELAGLDLISERRARPDGGPSPQR
jgi:anti-anti-sigma factor